MLKGARFRIAVPFLDSVRSVFSAVIRRPALDLLWMP